MSFPEIPLFDLRLQEEDVQAVLDVLRSGWLTMGPRTAEFERAFAEHLGTTHAIAGEQLTLDQMETTILANFDDPRVYLALGRGAVGSGRLRSEAFSAKAVDKQLTDTTHQFAVTPRWAKVDVLAAKVSISPILSWRSAAFISKYAEDSYDLPKREPLERAVIGFLRPHLLDTEEAFIKKNTFQLTYEPFDWRLNDLTGGRPD